MTIIHRSCPPDRMYRSLSTQANKSHLDNRHDFGIMSIEEHHYSDVVSDLQVVLNRYDLNVVVKELDGALPTDLYNSITKRVIYLTKEPVSSYMEFLAKSTVSYTRDSAIVTTLRDRHQPISSTMLLLDWLRRFVVEE